MTSNSSRTILLYFHRSILNQVHDCNRYTLVPDAVALRFIELNHFRMVSRKDLPTLVWKSKTGWVVVYDLCSCLAYRTLKIKGRNESSFAYLSNLWIPVIFKERFDTQWHRDLAKIVLKPFECFGATRQSRNKFWVIVFQDYGGKIGCNQWPFCVVCSTMRSARKYYANSFAFDFCNAFVIDWLSLALRKWLP